MPQSYTIRSGDTLSEIADMFEVAGGYRSIAELNGINDPNMISVGQQLQIPGGDSVNQDQEAPAQESTYTVQRGDTLSTIAQTQLGSIFAFQDIYDLNRGAIGSNPNRRVP